MTVTPLANGTYAIGLASGVEIERVDDGHFFLRVREEKPPKKLEEILRARMLRAIAGLQEQAGDVLRFGQAVLFGVNLHFN